MSEIMRHAGPRSVWRLCVTQFEEVVAGVALVAVVFAVSWGVITRYITTQPAAWAGEIATIGFAWVIFFGASACVKRGLHPAVDVPIGRLPPRLRQAVTGLNHVLIIAFLGFMIWFGTRFSIDAWDNPTPVLRWPLTILYGPVTLCSALMLFRYVRHVILGRPAE